VAPLPHAPGIAKIIIKQTLAGVNVYNIMHARAQGGSAWSGTECANMATAVRSAWVTNVIPLQASSLTLTDVQVVDLTSDTGNEGTASGTTNGTAVGTALSSNVAITWSWKIGRRYRGGHPRTYIAGCPQSAQTTPNTILASAITAHTNAATAIKNAITGVTVGGNLAEFVVLHYYRDKTLLDPPDYSYITSVSVDSRLDSQRRRLGRDR
jgi:hypothetical protein